MNQKKENDLQNYILELASHGGEPLYILLSCSVEENGADSYQEVIDCIFSLYKNGFLKCDWHSMKQGGLVKINDLKIMQLQEYLKQNEKDGFEDYPKEGGEYFFETTEEGESMIPEYYYPPDFYESD